MSGVSWPVTLNPGQTATLTVGFDPTAAGAAAGAVTITDNATPGTALISLSGTGTISPGVLSGLTCASGAMTGAGTDACVVTLSASAGPGGLAVNLSSSSSAVTVPAAVTVAAGATSAAFTATATAVTTAQTATLTASAGSVTETYAIGLGAAVPALTVSPTSVAFGDISLNSPGTETVTLTSSGTAALTISAGAIAGTGFSMSGVSWPVTLNPGQTATLNIQFDPTATGAATGTVTLSSNASSGSTTAISLTGTGETPAYEVDLSWDAPISSSDPVAGYNIYRAVSGSSTYALLNSTADGSTTYADTTVVGGTAYIYYVESVDAEGNQSGPSNTYSVTIP
jgi:hypothetical protein